MWSLCNYHVTSYVCTKIQGKRSEICYSQTLGQPRGPSVGGWLNKQAVPTAIKRSGQQLHAVAQMDTVLGEKSQLKRSPTIGFISRTFLR